MDKPAPAWTDERTEQIIGTLLRAGVILSTVVVLLGAGFFLFRHGDETYDYRTFQGQPEYLCKPAGIVEASRDQRGGALIQLGLLLLIATPVARVVFSVFAFAMQRDRTYIIVTLVVLSVLFYSLFVDHH